MVPKPVSYDSYSSDDFEDEAPETVTFSSSKTHAKKLRNARDAAVADAKRKVRDRRRQAMRKTREEAQKKKEEAIPALTADQNDDDDDGEREGPEEDDRARELQARMDRAMMDADDEEGDDDDDNIDEEMDGNLGEGGSQSGLEDSMDGEDVDEEPEDDVDEVLPEQDYLPDHIFAEALSKLEASPLSSKRPAKQSPVSEQEKRKSKKKFKTKDVIIGSKTIRTVSWKYPVALAASRNKQPAKVKRFVDTTLGFKGSVKSKRSRSRQPVNIGIMRSRTQPAFGFVRGS